MALADKLSNGISIHALREEGDTAGEAMPLHLQISIHALREEGDPSKAGRVACFDISIHALREEGDLAGGRDDRAAGKFLSTPSARRATGREDSFGLLRGISIHALREEGDLGRRNDVQ